MSRYIHARCIEIDQFFSNYLTNFSDDILFENGLKKIIAVNFPQKISEQKTSAEFKRTPRWLQIKCKQVFNLNYIHLMRALRVYYSLRAMIDTNYSNHEIAEKLNYTELSSMNRDFKKELNFYPDAARVKLISMDVDSLFHNYWIGKTQISGNV